MAERHVPKHSATKIEAGSAFVEVLLAAMERDPKLVHQLAHYARRHALSGSSANSRQES